jgi:hypothetical protein
MNSWDEDVKRHGDLVVAKLLPEDIPLNLCNIEYLQKHPNDARAILAVAKAERLLGIKTEEQFKFKMDRTCFQMDIMVSSLKIIRLI